MSFEMTTAVPLTGNSNGFFQWMLEQNLSLLAPEAIILTAIVFMFFISLSREEKHRNSAWWVAIVYLAIALSCLFWHLFNIYWPQTGSDLMQLTRMDWFAAPVLYGAVQADLFGLIMRMLLVSGAGLLLFAVRPAVERNKSVLPAEFYITLMTALLGGMILASASDLITVFVSLETLGIASYVLASSMRGNVASAEGGLKYLVYGGASSACVLMGFALFYGLSGGYTDFAHVSASLQQMMLSGAPESMLLLAFASVLTMVGVGFKLSAAPFHMWTPDVYEGSPLPVTAFLSVVSKVAAFAFAVRLLGNLLMPLQSLISMPILVMAVLSMTIGNVLALVQTNLKRLLAYSTIAHAGYMLLGLYVGSQSGIGSLMFYLVTYMVMNLGAFASAMAIANMLGSEKTADYAGLFTKRPMLVLMFSIALLSLAGIPVTSGFFAKFYLFKAVAEAGAANVWLVVFALLNSTISLYYYINIIRLMVVAEPSVAVAALPDKQPANVQAHQAPFATGGLMLALTLCTVVTLVLGFVSGPFYDLMMRAALPASLPRIMPERMQANSGLEQPKPANRVVLTSYQTVPKHASAAVTDSNEATAR
ncbi:MAG: NADH-quinone oxidoreductase subunit N [Vampirovibrionales bacterium]|nr:NADH-quinone oxidoreductase subunit N [Vampirovibrionales bacterium]